MSLAAREASVLPDARPDGTVHPAITGPVAPGTSPNTTGPAAVDCAASLDGAPPGGGGNDAPVARVNTGGEEAMITIVPIDEPIRLTDYSSFPHLAAPASELQVEASMVAPLLRDRTVWMVNSTAKGGGVAEMLPKMVALMGELGPPVRWAVVGTGRQEFFNLTKRLHNLIHGEGDPHLGPADRELYESVSRQMAQELRPHLGPRDILLIHDPQPLAVGAMLKAELGLHLIWRCHIGLDRHTEQTRAAWNFLKPYAEPCDHAVFSAPEYIPDYLAGYASIIQPALDPLSHKNRDLSPHRLVGILCNGGMKLQDHPVVTPDFEHQAQRLVASGQWVTANEPDRLGLIYRPIVTQVSRWDRLKGFAPLLEGFVRLKQRRHEFNGDPRHQRRLQISRLVLAGPDPGAVSDDPEAIDVLDELVSRYLELPAEYQVDIALLKLPMQSRKENALMVNALQRCSTLAVQNSLREGFGLTATEAMWKQVATLGTNACGLREQIRNGIDGLLIQDPENPDEIALKLERLLRDVPLRTILARNAQRRVHEEFLIFNQLRLWLRLLGQHVTRPVR
jgi:trehalose synthase